MRRGHGCRELGLGLGEYEQNFWDNKIDADVLADLTGGDLEKLGLPLGNRKRLLRAIGALASHKPPSRKTRHILRLLPFRR